MKLLEIFDNLYTQQLYRNRKNYRQSSHSRRELGLRYGLSKPCCDWFWQLTSTSTSEKEISLSEREVRLRFFLFLYNYFPATRKYYSIKIIIWSIWNSVAFKRCKKCFLRSTGSKMVARQSLKCLKKLYLVKRKFFKYFELWQAAFIKPLDLEKRYVPQNKALKHSYFNL